MMLLRRLPSPLRRLAVQAGAWAAALLLVACGPQPAPPPAVLGVAQIHALMRQAAPQRRVDAGWASDMQTAFVRLDVPATRQNVCAAVAVVAQESGFVADPEVPGLADITLRKLQQISQNPAAWAAINVRLRQQAEDGRTYYDQLLKIRTEHDLERWYQAFMGARLTGRLLKLVGKDVDTLISTLGSMQVSVAFARGFAREHDIPERDIRERLYTRAGDGHDHVDEHGHPGARDVHEDDPEGVPLLVVGGGEPQPAHEARRDQEGREHREPGHESARQAVEMGGGGNPLKPSPHGFSSSG